MQPHRLPTPVMASSNFNIFASDFSTKSQVTQTVDQPALHWRSRSANMTCQLHLPNPFFHNIRDHLKLTFETQHPITHSTHDVPPPPKPLVNPPPFIPPPQIITPQIPVIPSSIPASTAANIPVPNKAQQSTVNSLQATLVPFPTAPKRAHKSNFDQYLWHFPLSDPSNVNQATKNAATFQNF